MSYKMSIPEDLRKKYLSRRKKDLEELRQGLAVGDFEPFVRIGHQLKGNGSTYGYEELGALGVRLEEAGRDSDKNVAGECLAEFLQWVANHVGPDVV